jgi:excinuclease ABC subunit C
VEVISAAVRNLPNAPGVYRMIDGKGGVLYVGKARSLKKRVTSYTRLAGQSSRIARMINATAAMDFVRTRTETEALLLEANLIKRLRPRFNVLLRDDKSFPYILIAEDHEAPVDHEAPRRAQAEGQLFRSVRLGRRGGAHRQCAAEGVPDPHVLGPVFESRTRPCLLYQIKRCSGPCTREIAVADYRGLVGEAKAFLSGSSRQIKSDLAQAMEAASSALDFERAALYRDRLAALSHVQAHQGINPQNVEEADVFAVHQDGGLTCIQVFFFRTGQNWGNRAYFPKADKSVEAASVLESFLAQFYDDKPVPRLVLVSTDFEERELLATALCERSGHRVEISVPQRGEKRELVEHALSNAREALGRRLAETSTQTRLLAGVAEAFGLPSPPRRIEVFDNSHVMGTNAVGAMIVTGPEGFSKNHYRKFNIRSRDSAPGDDYAMMREVMRRRFGRLLKENGPRPLLGGEATDALGPWPDLLLVDGGKGQLAAVAEVLAELGLEGLPVVSVAKGRDRDLAARLSSWPGASRSCCRTATRCCISSSACGTRRIASPSARTGHAAKRKCRPTRSTRSPGSGRPASARCSGISARRRPSAAPAWRT